MRELQSHSVDARQIFTSYSILSPGDGLAVLGLNEAGDRHLCRIGDLQVMPLRQVFATL